MMLMATHYWPALVAALIVGLAAGVLAFAPPGARERRLPRGNVALILGAITALVLVAAWHGPLAAGDRFAGRIEKIAMAELQKQEMGLVRARLQRGPLKRQLVLSGPADPFQQRELARIMSTIPGVSSVRWANPPALGEAGR